MVRTDWSWDSELLFSEMPMGSRHLYKWPSQSFTYGIQLLLFYLLSSSQLGLRIQPILSSCLYRKVSHQWTYLLHVCLLICAIYLSTHCICLLISVVVVVLQLLQNESEFRNDIQLDFSCPEGFLGVLGSPSI